MAILLATVPKIMAIANFHSAAKELEPAVRWFMIVLASVGLFWRLVILIC